MNKPPVAQFTPAELSILRAIKKILLERHNPVVLTVEIAHGRVLIWEGTPRGTYSIKELTTTDQ
jgi:hypothetical protein